VNLYLLDSNDAANFPLYRGITSELYGGDGTTRFLQELVLGMGGWRLMKLLGIRPQVCHLNEGHAAFVVVERALDLMETLHLSFEEALAITRCGNVFTTHTSIGAGFDLFEPGLITHYLEPYIKNRLQISVRDFLSLGRKDPDDDRAPFNTSFLAMRGSGFVNGVSRLHGQVSRQVFASVFPRYPLDEVPVDHITNGVHMSTWDSPASDKLWTETCGKERWLGTLADLPAQILAVPLESIWQMRQQGKETFLHYIRERYGLQLATLGRPAAEIETAKTVLDKEALTIGIARRFISYKRPALLLQDRGRLRSLLLNTEKPIQLVLAGKAHRRDEAAQALIKEWVQFIQNEGLQNKIVFLSDYDMHLCEHMVQGVDVWINTPRRPWEACGTSGMKVLVNGGLNLSVLDGWWDEAYQLGLGWAIGEGGQQKKETISDNEEASQLYRLLEEEILPLFYTRNTAGIPVAWVTRVRESMARLTPQFSSNRSLREYVERFYLPAAALYDVRVADAGKKGKKITSWIKAFREKWNDLQILDVKTYTTENVHFFEAGIKLGGISEDEIKVELFADAIAGGRTEKYQMIFKGKEVISQFAVFTVSVPTTRHASDYTVRVVPLQEDIKIPLELNCIRWHH
jgi:starch phosphorylase